MMFCSDDKHPDSLVKGHINELCSRAVKKGINVFKVLRAACINPAAHYQLETGMLQTNDPADFILVKDLEDFEVIGTFISGISVAEKGKSKIASVATNPINRFNGKEISSAVLKCEPRHHLINNKLPVIEALDGQLITNKLIVEPLISNNEIIADIRNDILKLVVMNRYQQAAPAIAFIKNFGIKKGAIASSVAHDSHNIIAVGAEDESIANAINLVIREKGGVSCVTADKEEVLPLPVAGLMSADDGYKVAEAYSNIDKMAKSLGSTLSAPFMTLSFMALLVIPSLKLSDKGLFDGDNFKFLR
jgi:adenine deaminase